MSDNEAGAFLNITPDVLKKLDSFDEKLEKIEKHAHTAADALKNGFGSVVVDTRKLESAIASLASKIGALNTTSNSVGNIGTAAQGSARGVSSMNESLTRAAWLLNQIGNIRIGQNSFSGWNIAELKEGISDIKKFVENTKTLSKAQQQQAVEAMRYMKMELDYQRQTDEQRAQSAEKAAQRKEAADRRAYKAGADLAKAQNYKQNTTAQGALDFSKTANTLQRQITAIEYLKKARLSLNTTDANYRQTLEQINQAIAKHNQALQQAGVQSQQLATRHRNLMDTAGQLSRQLALVFSVSQIEGYISKIVKVRGEFELQQVALRAIIQDKDKADKIFSQTLNQALKSPFQAGQLVTFTKQLAAYRIESDKLFDTTKRLADVSAGLGVDMQRLILAYGQVKAAAYLRGSEVRQFTEAGINMYGELQSYFEEVKGEAYTTAQIVDMISKRMVKFEDVEAVFQRMTDKGGLFYNMQEVQVNTLHGQINRLKDVISIMQNEIGKSNQEGFLSISTAIDLANALFENWRTVASILKTVVLSYGTLKAVSGVMWLAERAYMAKDIAQQRVRISLKWQDIMATRAQAAANAANGTAIAGAAVAQRGLNAAIASNPYGAILAVLVAVGSAIYEVVQNTNRLKKALDGIAAEGAFSVVQSSNNYAQLASVVTDSTKSYQEHNKALAELKRKYSDILPEQYLNAEGIKALNGNYSEAIKVIHQYINAKTKERMIDEVGQDANKEIYANQQKTAKAISKIIEEQHGMKVSWNEISSVLNEVQDKLLSGAIKSTQQLREETEKVVEQYTGLGNIDLSDYFTQLSGSSFGGADKFRFDKIQIERSQFRDWFESAKSYISQVESIEQRFSKGSISMTAQRYQEQKEAADKMIANAMSAYDVLRDSQKENTKVTKEELENAKNLVQKALKSIGSNVKVDSEYMKRLFNDSFFFEEEKQKATQTKLKQLFDKLTKEAKESGDTSGAVWLQEFEKQINGLNLNPLQNSIKKFLQGVGGNEDIQANWNIRSGETEAEFKKRIKSEIDTRNEIIRKSQSSVYPEYGQDTNKVKSELEELNRLYNELGGDKKKGRSSAERNIWAERISVLKEMQSRYEKLNQLMGENRAIEETRSAFKGALDFTQMGEVIKAEDIIPTKQGMIDALEKLLEQIPNDVKNAAKRTGLEKEIAELKIGIQQDYLKEQLDKTKQNIEDMFNGLDLHQKLKDAGLSESEVQALFPGLAKTLDEVERGIHEKFNALRDDNGQLGKTEQKDYEDALNKLNQQRIKDSQDLVIELTKAYKTQLSDQLQLDMWYYKERSKIYTKVYDEQTKTFKDVLTKEMQEQYSKNLKTQYDKKSSENTWKAFKGTDTYLNMFDNLENVSTKAIENMKAKLETLKEQMKDLDPSQLKEVMNFYNKMDEQLFKRSPLESFLKSYEKIKELKSQGITEEGLLQRIAENDIENTNLQQQISDLNTIIALKKESIEKDSVESSFIEKNKDLYNQSISVLESMVKAKQDTINDNNKENKNANKNLKYFKDARSSLEYMKSAWDSVRNAGRQAMGSIVSILETMGEDTDSTSMRLLNMVGTIGDLVIQAVIFQLQLGLCTEAAKEMGVAMNAALGPIGWVLIALQAVATILSSIFGNHDKDLQKEIEEHERKIKKLEREYDKLKESIDNVWDITKLQEYGNELDENINKQIVSLNAMIAAERDKKDTDWDKINEWQEQIEDLRDTLADSANDMIAELGGVGSDENFKTLAENFASAWLEAFQETGDGLSGLQDSFDDFMENYVKQQILLRLSDKFFGKMFEEFDNLIATRTDMEQEDQERYFELQAQITKLRNTANNSVIKSVAKKANAAADEIENSEEYKKLQEAWTDFLKPNDINTEAIKDWSDRMQGVFGEYNEAAEEIFNQIGWEPGGKANLSALQQGIQGITETTAEALEALLNSIRFFVSQQTTDITAIRNLLEARYSLESQAETNPMLIELKAQTGYLEIISDRIDRVFAPNSNSRGAGLRVFISD